MTVKPQAYVMGECLCAARCDLHWKHDTRLQAIADAWGKHKPLQMRNVREWQTSWNKICSLLDALIGGYEVVDDDIELGPGLAEALTQADEIDALTEEGECS